MVLESKHLEEIGAYVQTNLAGWLAENSLAKPPVVYEIELRERMVRVEEELRHQRELMKQGFELMEKRFEAVDKRFEAVDKRFEAMNKRFESMERRMDDRFHTLTKRIDRFMIWSFSINVSAVIIIVATFRVWPI
uniref:DUF1640 domain-containing protein n=1 Tax=Candidatus Kentrum sp. UNK TaxID=2126344 RepID=A0A451B2G8_9GAMM|nr:MAG: hypothetical protein BECKUNK1418G_GA0071005_11227 [Candidatus Kentron sp. UNK]VFK72462.1 MAG: hypothetical protein BECKUNK1418H_GA0071006_11167 [Candidatus Kentron sp. UNK]